LLEEISESFNANLAVDGLGQVQIPELKGHWIAEEVQATLVNFERVFEITILFQEIRVVDHCLRCRDTQFENSLVDFPGLFQRGHTLDEIDIETPQLPALVHSLLRG
jgi:hypothetical protein